MRNRIVTTELPDVLGADHRSSTKHAVVKAVRCAFTAAIEWLRAGYPEMAPRTGHSSLLALYGPLALTPAQRRRIVEDLEEQQTDTTDIEVAITKATNRLATPTQTRAIYRELNHRTSQQ